MMIVLVFTTKNPPISNGYFLINKLVPIILVIGLCPLTLLSFSLSLSYDYENNVILRLNLFKISTIKIFLSKIIISLSCLIIQIILIVSIAFAIKFKLPSVQETFVFFITFIFITITMYLLAWMISLMCKRFYITQIVGMFLMFAFMIFLDCFSPLGDEVYSKIEFLTFLIPTHDISFKLTSYWLGDNINISYLYLKYLIYDLILTIIILFSVRHQEIILFIKAKLQKI